MSALWPQVYARPAAGTPVDVDEDLYGGFVGNADRRRLNDVLRLSPAELSLARTGFDDARLGELVWRYRARNFPDTLNETDQARWAEHRAGRLIRGDAGALTLQAFFDRIDGLAESADDERAQGVLEALYEWGEHIAPEV